MIWQWRSNTLKSNVENVRKDFDALVASVAAQEASGRSRDSLAALKQEVVERPITSLLT
jgi:hypothetical protein